MSHVCDVTGKRPGFGNNVSPSHDPDRLVLRKYDAVLRRHVELREER